MRQTSLLLVAPLFLFVLILPPVTQAEPEPESGSFQFLVLPRVFSEAKSGFGKGTPFSRPGIPEVAVKVGFMRTSFHLEPVFGFGFLLQNSKSAGGQKSKFQMYELQLGLRQSFWSKNFFPLVPYAEALGGYRLVIFETKTPAKVKSNGGELTTSFGGGLNLSFAAMNPALKTELDGIWGLVDYGMNIQGFYNPGGLLRTGKAKDLSSFKHFSFGGGLYVAW